MIHPHHTCAGRMWKQPETLRDEISHPCSALNSSCLQTLLEHGLLLESPPPLLKASHTTSAQGTLRAGPVWQYTPCSHTRCAAGVHPGDRETSSGEKGRLSAYPESGSTGSSTVWTPANWRSLLQHCIAAALLHGFIKNTVHGSLAWTEAPAKSQAGVSQAPCQFLAVSGNSSVARLLPSTHTHTLFWSSRSPGCKDKRLLLWHSSLSKHILLLPPLPIAIWLEEAHRCPLVLMNSVFSLTAETSCKNKGKKRRRLLLSLKRSFFNFQVTIPFSLYWCKPVRVPMLFLQ